MKTVDKKEHISADSITEIIDKMSAEELYGRAVSLCRNINTLLEGISNLIDEEKELTYLCISDRFCRELICDGCT